MSEQQLPSIETVVENLLSGETTKQEAINWLYQHAQDAHQTLTDYFAGLALNSLIAKGLPAEQVAIEAYAQASEMMKVRQE